MNAGNNISQTLSAESGVRNDTFPQTSLKEPETTFYSQACAYYPKLTEGEISQQSADQLFRFHLNPVEFAGFRMQAELFFSGPELEEEK